MKEKNEIIFLLLLRITLFFMVRHRLLTDLSGETSVPVTVLRSRSRYFLVGAGAGVKI